jgi:hypothetical protein
MKTTAATLALVIAFLSAGALAGNKQPAGLPQERFGSNVTIVEKNHAWPPAGWATALTCESANCIAI